MRKLFGIVILSALVLTFCSTSAKAQVTQITLGGTASCMTFTGTGSGNPINLTLGNCIGPGLGQGGLSALGSANFFIGPGASSTTTLTQVGSSNVFNVAAPANSFLFRFGDTNCVNGTNIAGCLLTGNLALVNLTQSGQGGVFNLAFGANLTNIGGTQASLFPTIAGVTDITIVFSSATPLQNLGTGEITAGISSGEIRPIPEPGSVLLLGSGLLGLGVALRRRLIV